MAKIYEFSVFFPTYNEEANIENTIHKVIEVLKKIAKKWEIIVVNDGSTDKTGEIVKKLIAAEPRIKMIIHTPNQGYGAALKSGFYNSKYEWIVYTDADGQFDFAEISKLLDKQNEAEVVVGYRINRQDSALRKLFGWGWTMLANLLLGIRVRDVDCGFKLVKKEVIEKIPALQSTRGGMVSPELLAKAKKDGFRITEVGVHHYPRKAGKQTGANLKVIFNSFLDLGKLWWQLK